MPTKVKLAGVFAVLVAASMHLWNSGYTDWHAGADTAYVMILLLLFFGRETSDDERVQSLKLQALFVAFGVSWVVAIAARFAFYLQDRTVPPPTLSSFDAMFIMLLVAHGLFQVGRWRDGRESHGSDQRNPW